MGGWFSCNGASSHASLFTQQGKKGVNQDAMLVWEDFGAGEETVFCGVFDGHGPYGHMIAKHVRDSLPLKLRYHWSSSSGWDDGSEPPSCDEPEKRLSNFLALKDSFLNAFEEMDKELSCQAKFDCSSSGTTAIAVIKHGQDLVLGNVGDSRAIVATREDDGSLVAVQMTVDLKPDSPGEEQRIRRCKGRIFALQDEPDVQRIWLPDMDAPGLAMSRAFGDFCLKDFGLISVPDVYYRRLTERDEFVVLATDGIWDVLSNAEVVSIVMSARSRQQAAHLLVESAVKAWRCKFPTSKVDDCAVVCLYLKGTVSSKASYAGGRKHAKSPDGTVAGVGVLRRSGTVTSHNRDF